MRSQIVTAYLNRHPRGETRSYADRRERLHFLHLVGQAVDILDENLNEGGRAVVTAFLGSRRERQCLCWLR